MDAFDVLYALAADEGRGEALFGTSIEQARPVYERTLVGNGYPAAYLEFPLMGKPSFDLLSVHGFVEQGARFADGAGFGYQAMVDWFAGVCEPGGSVSCGIELDTSSGETERAGVYLQQRRRHELVVPFLKTVGESRRAQSYLDVLERMPEGWPPAYVGLFPGRSGVPMRIGGYMGREELAKCAGSAAYLGDRFRAIGFTAFDGEMLDRCTKFMSLAPSVDFQFDIMPDGSLGNAFGLSLSFNETKPRQAHDCMEHGYGAQLMQTLQDWNLADDRWKLIADAAFARRIPYEREDGSMGHLAFCVLFNYAKVKFIGCQPQPAKFYLQCKASDLQL